MVLKGGYSGVPSGVYVELEADEWKVSKLPARKARNWWPLC